MADSLSYLLENGMSLDEIEQRKRDGISVDDQAKAAESIINRGGSLLEGVGTWEPPIPFDEVKTHPFPVDSLPAPVAAFVEALAESTQTPEEMAGVLSLGVLSTIFQSRYTVQVTPDWREPLCLWPVAVAAPAERKSAVLSTLMEPVRAYEAERRSEEAAAVAQNQNQKELLKNRLEAAKKRAVKKGGPAEDEVMALTAELTEFKEMVPFRLLVDDLTSEKLADIMEAQGGSITLCSSEGGIFDVMAGRYEKAANFDIYLKGHAGDSISVDRIMRKGNYIHFPRLSMILTVQPEVLNGLMGNPSFRGRGLCGRFLYVICKSKIGQRKITPEPIPNDVRVNYNRFVYELLKTDGSGVIHLDPEADRIRQEYQAYVEKKLPDTWESMQDWGGKVVGAMVRIAALIHCATVQVDPTQVPISPEVMAGAALICSSLETHAEAAYRAMGAGGDYEPHPVKRTMKNYKRDYPKNCVNFRCGVK